VELTMSFQTKREVIRQMIPCYRNASVSQKGALLDEIAATTGYARRYAMWLLNHPQEIQLPPSPSATTNVRTLIASREVLPTGKILTSFPCPHFCICRKACVCFELVLETFR
jgi:hypothetical protein